MSERRLRVGVAGLGRAFTLMLPTFLADPRVELVAACDPRAEARERFVRDFPAARAHERIEALAADDAVEVVYVSTPHQLHAEHARVAARRGRHVLVEKPMALTLDECASMIDACDEAGVALIVGHSHGFDAPYLAARRVVDSGEVGRVRMVQALNWTDFLYRPRRPEELDTARGGGVVFSQAAHQVDVVRLLAGGRATHVRARMGAWDPARPTEGAYSALLGFEDGAFAALAYSGYGRFDSDEWCGWIGEMGAPKDPEGYGAARRRLSQARSPDEEARLKNEATYGGPAWRPAPPSDGAPAAAHQHFGPVLVCCERADLRPLPDALWVYADERRERRPLPPPAWPRAEVIDELHAAVVAGAPPVHDGRWARATLEVCLAMLRSSREDREVPLRHQVGLP